jgi:hypothetical protein
MTASTDKTERRIVLFFSEYLKELWDKVYNETGANHCSNNQSCYYYPFFGSPSFSYRLIGHIIVDISVIVILIQPVHQPL